MIGIILLLLFLGMILFGAFALFITMDTWHKERTKSK